MAATVQINERNGVIPGTETSGVTNLNMGSSDIPNLNTSTYPITAMAGGASYEKYFRLYVSNLGGSSSVSNIRIWLSSIGTGFETGEAMKTNLVTSGYTAAVYAQPVNTTSTAATQTMPTTQPSSANIGIGGSLAGSVTVAPAYSDYVILQEQVTASTPAGAVQTKTISILWDEQ